jgi:hypothetical protein
MVLWLLLGYLLISVVFGLLVCGAIRLHGAGSCDRPLPAAATRPATGDRAALGVRMATGR